jgi:hypothetical protein
VLIDYVNLLSCDHEIYVSLIPKKGCLTVSTPYHSPYGYPTNVPGGQKVVNNVLIPF